MGRSKSAVVLFKGQKVPFWIMYGNVEYKCNLYKKNIEVCDGHACSPSCGICGKAHPTGDTRCKQRFKTPYILQQRQWEKKKKQEESRFKEEDFPPLLKGRSRSRSRSRSRASVRSTSRQRSGSRRRSKSRRRSSSRQRVSWARVTDHKASEKKSKEAKTQNDKLDEILVMMRQLQEENKALRVMVEKTEKENAWLRTQLQQKSNETEKEPEKASPPAKRKMVVRPGQETVALDKAEAPLQQEVNKQVVELMCNPEWLTQLARHMEQLRTAQVMLRNLSNEAITGITKYINECWRQGQLPRQWKTAKVVLIPKPGKKPQLDALRPISLTSCVGKIMEHAGVRRINDFKERNQLFPHTMVGFRPHLSTQDVMLRLKHQIIDGERSSHLDTRVILGLDHTKAFDTIRHDAVLENLEKLGVGRRTFNYIQDFLSDRTAQISIGDITSDINLGGRGTPQDSVLSPYLYNVAMIELPAKLSKIEGLHHSIYADDITLWMTGGCDGFIQDTLQEAIQTIEEPPKPEKPESPQPHGYSQALALQAPEPCEPEQRNTTAIRWRERPKPPNPPSTEKPGSPQSQGHPLASALQALEPGEPRRQLVYAPAQ
ncbi:uncharacterized protein ISCGN_032577 [Ixodes scapularis]